jgi:hypothetical protein
MTALMEKYAAEWVRIGDYVGILFKEKTTPKRSFPISPEENLRRMLTGCKPVYMPTNDDMLFFAPRIIPDNTARAWAIEADPILPGDPVTGGFDMFGVEWEYVPVTMGAMVRPGSPKIRDISHWEDDVAFPDPDAWDWEGSAQRNAKMLAEDRMRRLSFVTGLNERLISLMDFDKVMLAYIDEDQKPGVHRFFDRLCTFYDGLLDRYRRYYSTDIVMFNDDWGTQRGPQFSLNAAREMLVPYMRRIAESCHRRGMYLELHCCGKNDILAPAVAESGVDIWMPQEINDFELIFRRIGDRVILGIPTDSAPDMTDEEAYACAERFMDRYGKSGRVFLNTMHPQHPRTAEFLYALSREAYSMP